MNSLEFNKIAAGILTAVLVMLGVGSISDLIYATPHDEHLELYGIVEDKPAAPAGGTAAPEKATPLPVLLANASASAGEGQAKKCQACHNLQEGAGPKIGPDLYGVVGRKVASVAGFAYSDAMKEHGGDWTFEALNTFIDNPKKDVPGTKMAFAGIKNDQDRADLLVYLNTLGSNEPLPKVEKTAEESGSGDATEGGSGEASSGDATSGDAKSGEAADGSEAAAPASDSGDASGDAASADEKPGDQAEASPNGQ